MTTIHVINRHNRGGYKDVMIDYHRVRHDIFVDERGWNLRKPDGLEVDQFDTEDTVYLVAMDGGRVVGGSRFNPTVKPHMISEAFMHLVDRPLPRSQRTLEWSRYFIVRERRVGRTECRLLAAIQRYCLEENVTSLTGLQDMWWVPRWMQLGFTVHPLGVPHIIDGEPTMAVEIEISEAALASVVKMASLKSTALVRDGLSSAPRELAYYGTGN